MNVRWMARDGRTPKYFHTSGKCIEAISEYDEDDDRTARSLGMALCPDCEREERLNATTELGSTPLPAGG